MDGWALAYACSSAELNLKDRNDAQLPNGLRSSRMSRVDHSWTPEQVSYYNIVDDLLGHIGPYCTWRNTRSSWRAPFSYTIDLRADKSTDFDITLIAHHASGWMRAKGHASFYVNNGRPAPSAQHFQLCTILLPLGKNGIAKDSQNPAPPGQPIWPVCMLCWCKKPATLVVREEPRCLRARCWLQLADTESTRTRAHRFRLQSSL